MKIFAATILFFALFFLSGCLDDEPAGPRMPEGLGIGGGTQGALETGGGTPLAPGGDTPLVPDVGGTPPPPGYYAPAFIDEDMLAILNSGMTEREMLLALGWTAHMIDDLDGSHVTKENILNQMYFSAFIDPVGSSRPIGVSGTAIAPDYYAGMYFNDRGQLVVLVLPQAFRDADSRTAIEEMREKGLIVREAVFTEREMDAVIHRLNEMSSRVAAHGSNSWGRTATQVTIWIDPYTPEQIAIFQEFLQSEGFNLAMFHIVPAVTDAMRSWREERIAAAVTAPRDIIEHIGEADATPMGITFTLRNNTEYDFTYGTFWDLARYENGEWTGVKYLTGRGGVVWPSMAYILYAGETKTCFPITFEWRFGELPPGRYLFIRDGWLGEWQRDQEPVFALVEFEI